MSQKVLIYLRSAEPQDKVLILIDISKQVWKKFFLYKYTHHPKFTTKKALRTLLRFPCPNYLKCLFFMIFVISLLVKMNLAFNTV